MSMRIVIFIHPEFLGSNSMPRFSKMIEIGMQSRGHQVDVWTATPFFYRLAFPKRFKKFLGYIDQFILFPLQVLWSLRKVSQNTLFVFTDQALGPWVPLVAKRPHVIHAHDFLALRSALGEFEQNPTSWTGRCYQSMIRYGFDHGQAFVSVSHKTQTDLHSFLPAKPALSEVVYNGLNYPFRPMAYSEYFPLLVAAGISFSESGFLLHVGGNQWYKNRIGVIEIYSSYTQKVENPLPLFMIGPPPTDKLRRIAEGITNNGRVNFLTNVSNEQVCAAYSAARLLIFPSIAEGFGWPIAEAFACGCLVVTTQEAPMTEVGGGAAFYISKRPFKDTEIWASSAADRVAYIVSLSNEEQHFISEKGFKQVAQFDSKKTLDAYEKIYSDIIQNFSRN